ncbi:MAG TPA: site-2 protease family protein [Acidimicrobiales bacterium]|nr:site-2 protease family protein [Acidimicrobiales bacterium]
MSETDARPARSAAEEPGRPAGDATSWVRRLVVAAIVVSLGVWVSLPTLAIIAALVFFIFMHELGHYVTAKAAGMKVTEFFIGFGPRLWSFQRGETTYGVKAIPAGAYVRIIGMSNLEEVDPAEEGRTYRQKPYWRRMSVAVAGSTMHFLMAIVLFFVVVSVIGTPDPTSPRWTVSAITQGSAADAAGIQLGDRIVSVDGNRFASFDDMSTYLQANPGKDIDIRVERDGRQSALDATLGTREVDGSMVGFLGVGPEFPDTRVGPLSGAVEAVQATGETMWLSIKGLGAFFSPDGLSGYLDTLTGSRPAPAEGEPPDESRIISVVGAVQIASQSPDIAGAVYFLFAINVFIGVFNLVPLLPFDGGHVAIATYERIRSRRGRRYFADVAKLMPLTYAVVAVLAFVFLSSLYLDLVDPVSLQ